MSKNKKIKLSQLCQSLICMSRAESGGLSHYEENLNRRLILFLSVTTSLFPNFSSSAKTKSKSPFDERRLLEQNKRIQKENNVPEDFPSFIREGLYHLLYVQIQSLGILYPLNLLTYVFLNLVICT